MFEGLLEQLKAEQDPHRCISVSTPFILHNVKTHFKWIRQTAVCLRL